MEVHSANSRAAAGDFSRPAQASTCSKSYLVAAMRAGVIALILLGILALIVLF